MPNAGYLWKKFQQQEGTAPRAVRKFTDRQDFRQAYYALVERALKSDFQGCYIMNYYGIGGVGKSALLRRLEAELLGEEELPEDEARASCEGARAELQQMVRKKKKNPVALRADFDAAALKTPADVLLRFRAQLMHQYDKAMFPLFDIAMLRLSQKYGRRLPPDEQKEMLTDNPVISFALDVVGDFTGAGLLIGAAQTAAKVGQSVARALAGWKNVIRETNAKISRMDAPELERWLPCYFAMDVNAMDLPLVCVYLDTYEKMTARAEGAGRSTGFDEEWLRGDLGLVRNLGNAVFTIAGRERLADTTVPVKGQEQEQPVWDDLPFEDRYIKALSKTDSKAFLASCGIDDDELCAQLCRLTGGEPIYLDLCVDEYEHLTASGKKQLTIEDFGGSLDRLIERHTRYIPQDLRDALHLLAAMGRWTNAVCEELSRTLPIPSPAGAGYHQLTHLSYVQKKEGVWIMHRPVAKVLAGSLSSAMRKRLISALLHIAEREPAVLDILEKLFWTDPERLTDPDCRTVQAIERQAQADRAAGRYPEALAWQRRAVKAWKLLGSAYISRYGESLAAMADIQWAWLSDRPAPSGRKGETDKDVLRWQKGRQALRDLCREAIETCEKPEGGLEETLVRLWERRANAEDMLKDWDAAVSSWEKTLELSRKLERPEAVVLNARLQIGWDKRLAGQDEQARAILEDTLQGLAALDREEGRTYSPKTLLAAELLCQCYDDLAIKAGGLWGDRLARVQTWLRSLDYTLTGEEPLEKLLDWQDWIDVSHSSFWFHSGVGKEGADALECLQRAANLDEQVISGLVKHLGRQHPAVLDAGMTLANIYMNQESTRGASTIVGADYAVRLMEEDREPLGSVPAKNDCLFQDPERVLTICRELVEQTTIAMGREDPDTYRAKDLLAHACELAGRPEEAVPIRQELWSGYSRIYGETSKESALWQNSRLIEDNQRAGRWEEAIALQTCRLERVRAWKLPELPPEPERDRLCTLYLSRLWQDESLPQGWVRDGLSELLAQMEEFKPIDRRRYLDSAWQWCRTYAGKGLEDAAMDVTLALADALSFENDVIDLLEPWSEERSLSASRRCAVLLRLGRAYRGTRSGRERSVELLEELTELLEAHPEVESPDRGTALLELGLSCRKLAPSLVSDDFQRTAKEMVDAFRGALAWREERLPPEDPAADAARFELGSALAWVGVREEAVPLLETVVAFRRKTLGEAARETADAELKLVEALARTGGRYEEALSLFRQVQRHMEGMCVPPLTFTAQYALYRGAGGTLSFMEWQEAGEPERD